MLIFLAFTHCYHLITLLLLSERLIRMAAPIIIDVESDSDKENEAPEVVTGHTASFEANRSGET